MRIKKMLVAMWQIIWTGGVGFVVGLFWIGLILYAVLYLLGHAPNPN